MKVFDSIHQLTASLSRHACGEPKVGLVTAMGNLHDGHLSLIRKARQMSDVVVVMVFPNPTLVEDSGVLAALEAQRDRDVALLEQEDVNYLLFASRDELFPRGHLTVVRPEKLLALFGEVEGERYITGLATTFFQELNLLRPDFVFIGQKNYLDFYVLKRIIRDFHFSTEVVLCPTVRDEEGIAYSSYHGCIPPEDRAVAGRIYRSLRKAREMLLGGESSVPRIVQSMRQILEEEPRLELRFVGILDPSTLGSLEKVEREALILVTGKVGSMRMTDNILFRRNPD